MKTIYAVLITQSLVIAALALDMHTHHNALLQLDALTTQHTAQLDAQATVLLQTSKVAALTAHALSAER